MGGKEGLNTCGGHVYGVMKEDVKRIVFLLLTLSWIFHFLFVFFLGR